MRRRIVRAAVTVAVVGILVFGLPLAVVARRVVRDDELRRLDREADAVAFAINDDVMADRPVDPASIQRTTRSDRRVVVSDARGRQTTLGPPIERRALVVEVRTSAGATVHLEESARHADRRTLAASPWWRG